MKNVFFLLALVIALSSCGNSSGFTKEDLIAAEGESFREGWIKGFKLGSRSPGNSNAAQILTVDSLVFVTEIKMMMQESE